jgi:hypothetical protein
MNMLRTTDEIFLQDNNEKFVNKWELLNGKEKNLHVVKNTYGIVK